MDISIRGIDAQRGRRVLILEDGVPQAINPYGEPDLYYTPPWSACAASRWSRARAAFSSGPQTVGGVINFRTLLAARAAHPVAGVEGGDPAYVQVLGAYGDRIGDDTGFVGSCSTSAARASATRASRPPTAWRRYLRHLARRGATLKVSFHDEIADTLEAG